MWRRGNKQWTMQNVHEVNCEYEQQKRQVLLKNDQLPAPDDISVFSMQHYDDTLALIVHWTVNSVG